eukprot:scaffold350_cov333-Pavlova_lutheri.AAC.4
MKSVTRVGKHASRCPKGPLNARGSLGNVLGSDHATGRFSPPPTSKPQAKRVGTGQGGKTRVTGSSQARFGRSPMTNGQASWHAVT